MKFLKAAALALVVGAGMALVSTQARAQAPTNSSSTFTASINGNTSETSFEGSLTSSQVSATATSGDAVAFSAANPILGAASFSESDAGFSGHISGAESSTSDSTTSATTTGQQLSDLFQGSPYGPCNQFGCGGTAGSDTVLDGPGSTSNSTDSSTDSASFSAGFHVDNGHAEALAVNYVKLWVSASHSESQGSATTSGTSSTGVSVAGLFVFGQTTSVSANGSLTDSSPIAPVVLVSTGDFNGDTGNIALNQVAGVGNQQGNNLSTLLETTGANGTAPGSNSINVEGNQTLADAGTIGNGYTSGGESATIEPNAFQTISGAVAFNQAAGVANQQVNNLTLGH